MKRSSIFLLILILFFPFTIVNADNILESGEIVLDERINFNGKKELFTELNGQHYKKIIKNEEVIEVEKIELWPTGLKIKAETKDKDIEKALNGKLSQMGIYSDNLPSRLDYSNSPLLPPVDRQMEDSCVGWATGYYLRTYQQGMDLGWKIKDGQVGYENRIFSPSFIYNQINGGVDEGAYMEDAGDLLKEIGAATLENFPYRPGDYRTQPDSKAIESAYPHRIRDWKTIYTRNDSKKYIVEKTKEYLNTEDLLVAGIKVGFKFNDPWKDEYGNAIVTTENDAKDGHAVTIVGYDDNLETPDGQGAFKIVNSWGKDWGNDGFAYLTYENYATNIVAGYVFTDLVNDDYVDERIELDTKIEDGVIFEINLVGRGKYDIEILDNMNKKIHEEKDITGTPGLNKIYWNGLNLDNIKVEDGEYNIKLLGQNYSFNKEGRLDSATSYLNKLDGEIKSADVNVSTKQSGTMNLYILSNDKKTAIHKGLSLDKDKEYYYNIDILKYVNNNNLEDIKILAEIQ